MSFPRATIHTPRNSAALSARQRREPPSPLPAPRRPGTALRWAEASAMTLLAIGVLAIGVLCALTALTWYHRGGH